MEALVDLDSSVTYAVQIPAANLPLVATSSVPVQIYIIHHSRCHGDNSGSAALSIVVPTQLFYNAYQFGFPNILETVHYVIFVIEKDSKSKLMIGADHATHVKFENNITWTDVVGDAVWTVGYYKVPEREEKEVFTTDARKFGCYVYGVAETISYMHPAGFVSSDVEQIFCMKTRGDPGDLMDNDCDGWVDEEYENSRDDDKDGYIDEDLVARPRKHGGWSDWGEWHCAENCINSFLVRERACNLPELENCGRYCKGSHKDNNSKPCFVACEICDKGQFGPKCDMYCRNCDPDCDKVTGRCEVCKPGYRFPNASCNTPCPRWTWGENCKGECASKCSADCENRVTGDCPESMSSTYILLAALFVLPLACFVIFNCHKKRRGSKDDDDDDDDNDTYVPNIATLKKMFKEKSIVAAKKGGSDQTSATDTS
ncbi:netrin receptor unc-5-like [Physella acuta]|uniref:netrin receptor unc-5-like n=1 Tax=Physella acuta TaxID=109671 RepID=UPI0027DDDB16|nr:netrin receptor unc-5-like [Physella acuta]